MSTLARQSSTAASPALRLLERRPAHRAAVAAQPMRPRTLAARLEDWLSTLPEPGAHHRLGSWTALP